VDWIFCSLHQIRELEILDGSSKGRPKYASVKKQIQRVYCEFEFVGANVRFRGKADITRMDCNVRF